MWDGACTYKIMERGYCKDQTEELTYQTIVNEIIFRKF